MWYCDVVLCCLRRVKCCLWRDILVWRDVLVWREVLMWRGNAPVWRGGVLMWYDEMLVWCDDVLGTTRSKQGSDSALHSKPCRTTPHCHGRCCYIELNIYIRGNYSFREVSSKYLWQKNQNGEAYVKLVLFLLLLYTLIFFTQDETRIYHEHLSSK